METNKMNQPPETANKQQNGFGIAGLIIGIIALLLSCLAIGGFLGIIGLIFSIIAITKKNQKRGAAIAGIILNGISVIILILLFALAGSDDDDNDVEQSAAQSIVNETATLETEVIASDEANATTPSDITNAPNTQQAEQESQSNDNSSETLSENSAIELIAGEQGQYGELITMSEGTDMEESFYVYYVPTGSYTVTNDGEYMTQISVYEGIRKNAETGYDEYISTGSVLLLDTGKTGTIEIPDGWFIEIHEPTHISLMLNN